MQGYSRTSPYMLSRNCLVVQQHDVEAAESYQKLTLSSFAMFKPPNKHQVKPWRDVARQSSGHSRVHFAQDQGGAPRNSQG